MSFHIAQGLLLERTIAISMTIAAFGVITIGGLYLLKRLSRSRGYRPAASDTSPGADIEAIFRRLEAITRKPN
jgi:hypothetical protein